ncbi:hypothetical protein CRE_31257 [Caenorhabditis remanei]|uniref:F-box domain-containing protein n=1 Tax=Caenorhabditis remanei TaxID=31234 RepID=E3MLG5_CAERE|nr:hypothetical protein CRE_31257 [Caenorhabditis remanei]
MHKVPLESLKTNTNYLKSCILYEVLSGKPIFDCYRLFCERNGDDAMGYVDFEYWFYRFYNGDVDFTHERRTEANQKVLSGLPAELLVKITGYVNPEDRGNLRLTSKIFKAIVDMIGVTFKQIIVEWTENFFRLQINENCFDYLIYFGHFIRNGNPADGQEAAFGRFAQVLNHRKLLINRLALKLPFDAFPEKREQLLKCLPHSLGVKSAIIQASADETLTVVYHMKPGVLNGILVTGCPQELAPIFESEHWKQAEETNVVSAQNTSEYFPMFYNFPCFHIRVNSMVLNDLHHLIANVARNPSFQFCMVKAGNVSSWFVEPFPLEERRENDGSVTHRYQIPDSSHYLEIHSGNDSVYTIRRH